jgi:MFS family permease
MIPSQALPQAFWRLIAARTLYTFANQMQAVLIGWTVYAVTHSATALGMVGLAEAVPALGLALTAGDAVDGGQPLQIYRRALLATTVSGGILAAVLHSSLAASRPCLLLALYGTAFVTGIARAYFNPCIFALVPRMVPNTLLPRSAAAMSASLQLARVLGPAFGGLGYGLFGAGTAIDGVFGLLVLAQLTLLGMTVDPRAPSPASIAAAPRGQRLLEGLRFVFNEPMLLGALTLDMVSVLFGGVTAVLPIFAEEVLHIGSLGLGLLRAAPAVGATLVAVALAHMDIRKHAGSSLLVAVAGFGLCILGFALSRQMLLSWLLLALSGAFDGVSMMVRTLIVQLRSPDAMRGRISAVNSMFVGSSNEIGELESGLAAAYLGLVPSVLFGGTVCMLTVAMAALKSPTLRKLDLTAAPQSAQA